MRFLFTMRRAMLRLLHYPLVSFSLFTAFACIGALLAPYLGTDRELMMRAPALPFVGQTDSLRLETSDEEIVRQLQSLNIPEIRARALLEQQDEQCFTPRGLRILRVQSLIKDNDKLLNLPLSEDEAGLNPKFAARLGLREGESIYLQGEKFLIRLLRDNMEGGVDLMLRCSLPFGIRSYIIVLEPSEGVSAKELPGILQTSINRPVASKEQGGAVTYEITREHLRADEAALLRFYSSLLIILIGGTLFTLSQMTALMLYHTQKCRREDGLCRQWRGLSGMIKEQLMSIAPLAFAASAFGYCISILCLNAIQGTSPMGGVSGLLSTAGLTTVFAVVFAFLSAYARHRKKTLFAHMKEDV